MTSVERLPTAPNPYCERRKVREACHKHLRTIHPDKSGGIYSKDVAEAVSKMINDIKEQAV